MEIVEKLFRLKTGEELMVKVDRGKAYKVTVELKSGHAEIFMWTELVINIQNTSLSLGQNSPTRAARFCCRVRWRWTRSAARSCP